MSAPRHLAFVCAVAVGVASFSLLGCRPTASEQTKPLRIAIDLWPGYYPVILADELGYLKEERVSLDLQLPQDTHRMIADFTAHQHDAICVSLGDIVLATRAERDIRMILCSDESIGADQILGPDALRTADRIRGQRIGTTLGGFGEVLVRRFLDRHGVRANEVSLVNTDAAAVPRLLKSGEIDIGHAWEPYATEARVNGAQTLFTSADTPGLVLDGMIVRGDVLRSRPAEVRGLVRGWFRAVDWWRAHPAAGNALLARRLKISADSISLAGIRLHDRADNRRLFSAESRPSLRTSTSEYVEFFITRGTLGRRLAAEEILDPQFIE